MKEYLVNLRGKIQYDMMPKVKTAILICHGYIEDYEIEIDLDETNIVRVDDK